MIKIPEEIGPGLNFRWFVEHVIDNSPLCRSTSAVAKASLFLSADLDTVGANVEINKAALELVRKAVNSEDQPVELPSLKASVTDPDGNTSEVNVPARVYLKFINALNTDVEENPA